MHLLHALAEAGARPPTRYARPGKAPARWRIDSPNVRLICAPPVDDPAGPLQYTGLRRLVGVPGQSYSIRTRRLEDLLAWVARELPHDYRQGHWQLEPVPFTDSFADQVDAVLAAILLDVLLPASL